jgi:hypothetical protein
MARHYIHKEKTFPVLAVCDGKISVVNGYYSTVSSYAIEYFLAFSPNFYVYPITNFKVLVYLP